MNNVLILVFTSTFGRGNPPKNSVQFVPKMKNIKPNTGENYDFAVFALGNSAYVQTYAAFGCLVYSVLKDIGCCPITNMKIADELKNQNVSFFLSFIKYVLYFCRSLTSCIKESFHLFCQLLLEEKNGLVNNPSHSKHDPNFINLKEHTTEGNKNDLISLEFFGVTKVSLAFNYMPKYFCK